MTIIWDTLFDRSPDHKYCNILWLVNFNDNESFEWYLVRYLHPTDHHTAWIRKFDKDFAREPDFKEYYFLSKLKIFTKSKKTIVSALVPLVMETKKNVQFMLKNTFKRYADLLLLGEEGKRHYVLIKCFNTF